jgi:hypothetical protein
MAGLDPAIPIKERTAFLSGITTGKRCDAVLRTAAVKPGDDHRKVNQE